MVKYRNECVGCAVPGYPCRGDSCPNRHVKVLICDECGNEVDELWDGMCEECLLEFAKEHTTDHNRIN